MCTGGNPLKGVGKVSSSPGVILGYDPAGVLSNDENTLAGGALGPTGQKIADPLNLGGGQTPAPPGAPPVTAEAARPGQRTSESFRRKQRGATVGGTLLTGPRGLTAQATTQRKTLLGG